MSNMYIIICLYAPICNHQCSVGEVELVTGVSSNSRTGLSSNKDAVKPKFLLTCKGRIATFKQFLA